MTNKPTSELERGGYCVDQMPDMAKVIEAGDELSVAAYNCVFVYDPSRTTEWEKAVSRLRRAGTAWRAALVPPEKDAGK